MKKIFITGSNGLLGQKLVYKLLTEPGVQLTASSKGPNRLLKQEGYTYESLDITDAKAVETAIDKFQPDVVINTAAMTNVDACETEVDLCHKMNIYAVQYLVNALKKQNNNPQFIHLSTDFIFDGKNGPYRETDIPYTLPSVYSLSKLNSEKVVKESGIKWTIIRTVLVYGVVDNMSRSNIVLWAKDSLSKGKKINVVDDQFRTPTLAEDLAQGCILAALKDATGIYNISGKDFMSILGMVQKIADFWHLDRSLITPAKTNQIGQPAQRPLRTGFILDKAISELGYAPHSFTEGLAIVDEQLKKIKM